MKKMKLVSVVILGVFLIGFMGCQKKVTKLPVTTPEKTEPAPPPPVKEVVKPPEVVKEKKEMPKAVIHFRDVNFDYDKYDLRPDARDILSANAQTLRNNPQIMIQIEGHCDERGTVEYNLALGERRANAVKQYLMNSGVKENHLSTISYGKERPLDFGKNESAWAKNRRAAFVITEQ